MDPGLSEGCYKDNSLNPLPTDTPLLLHTSQGLTPSWGRTHTSQIALDRQPSDNPLDALDRHSSISEIPWHMYDLFIQADLDS
jgi:hypothetical protein